MGLVETGYNPATIFSKISESGADMSDDVVASGQGLSEVERVVDTFIAPSKTFTDILRSTSWWLPFLLMVLVTLGTTVVVEKQVGFDRVAENQIHQNPKQEEQLSNLSPQDRAARMAISAKITRYFTYGSFLLILAFVAIAALLYWASFNFGLGAQTTYGQMFAVWMYASLPKLLIGLLAIVMLLFGGNAESYNAQNPVGTNPAYFMPDAAPWLKAFLSFFDVIGLWSLFLLVIGTAIVAKVSRGKAAAVVVGWWLVGLVIIVGIAVASS